MLALADFCDDAGECWPSMATIAQKVRMTERGVQKIVRRLEAAGWLTINTGTGRRGCNQYRLNPEPHSPPNDVHPERECIKPRTRVQQTPNGGSPEPSRTVKEPSGSYIGHFDEFWTIVPRKVGKGKARTAYAKAVKKVSPERIFSAMQRYAAARADQDPQYTAHPASWLNAERWDDEPDQPFLKTVQGGKSRGNLFTAAKLAAAAYDGRRMASGTDSNPSQPLLSAGTGRSFDGGGFD